jgi:hypothetical protein
MIGLSEKLLAEREAKLDALGRCPPWWRPFARRRWRRRLAVVLEMDVSQTAEMLRKLLRECYPVEGVRGMAEERTKRPTSISKRSAAR